MKNSNRLRILIPLPQTDFDPTEVSVPWRALKTRGHEVIFATPSGEKGNADDRMLTGRNLGILKHVLMADQNGLKAYEALEDATEFKQPIRYEDIDHSIYDALLLPGGHAKGMRIYLESLIIQQTTASFFEVNKPVGAICHGTLVAGRSLSKKTHQSVLWGRKTTGLTKFQELMAWNLTRLWLRDYYRTYPITLEDELKKYLKSPTDFLCGPLPFKRDTPQNLKPGFTVLDQNYLSARWPGDAHKFAYEFIKLIEKTDF